jgi:hypothetical protein
MEIFLNRWFMTFWARKRKIPQNHTKCVRELPEVRMSDATENLHLDAHASASFLKS